MASKVPPSRASVAAALRRRVPHARIIADEEGLHPYECDGLPAYRRMPRVVVLPADRREVQAVVRYCHEQGLPLVARGAATGLSGGALPLEEGVLLGLGRLDRIVEIDPLARTARVQPGVRNLAVSQAAAAHGLYYAPDPSSQIACTIGGNVAENSGGVHCLKYGLTVHNVLSLEVVTAEGERVMLGSGALDAPGYDLLALFNGSEGMLGVVVEARLRLLPRPERAQVMLAVFDDVQQAADAVGTVIAAGIVPAGLEMMDQLAIRAAEQFVHAGYPEDAAAILLCELDGTKEEVSEQCDRARELLLQAGAREVRTARDEAERQRFWQGRKSAFPAVGRLAPDYYCMDGTVPRHALGKVLAGIARRAERQGLRVANVFHAGDGNLHPLILYDASRPGELERAEALGAQILELCVEVGGTITGEHGVGEEKLHQMCVQFSADELDQFLAVKRAFDPHGLLNPGKAIPRPRHCSEYRLLGRDLPRPAIGAAAGAPVPAGDAGDRLADLVRRAAVEGRALCPRGGGSKAFYGRAVTGEPLPLGEHAGVVDYDPRELVLVARAGTPLETLEALLAEQGQMLPFEPPHFGPGATLGGTLACGLSGPRRPWAGAARDFVLGMELLDGRGRRLRFGGRVMKNVAGYDIARLQCGALGTLGVILEASLKVLPLPETSETRVRECTPEAALEAVNRWAGRPLPLTASCYHDGRLYLRLEGTPRAVRAACRQLGGEPLEGGARFWRSLREQRHPFFDASRPLWRLSLPSTAPIPAVCGPQLIEWGGALRWLYSEQPAPQVRAQAEAAGGHATLFRGGDRTGAVFHPLPAPLLRLHRRLRRAFDPRRILNPGALAPDL